MTFGTRLKALRSEKNLTQSELVNEINQKYGTKINAAMWSKWENDKDTPSMDNVRILALYFDTTLDYLAELSDERLPRREHPSAMFKRKGLQVLFSVAKDLDDEALSFLNDMANYMRKDD